MLLLLGLLLPAAGAAGCSRTVQAENPFEIGAGEYHRVYEASIEVLREHRFPLDRQDRRFGVVTSGPLTAASAFEPWHDDGTTAYQVIESTLNHQRRRVRIEIRPLAERDAPDADRLDETNAEAYTDDGYELFVQVFVERRQHPPRELTEATLVAADLRRRPRIHQPVVTEAGLIESHWRQIGRDRELEQRLVAAIIRRSVTIDPAYPSTADADRPGATR